MTTATTIAIHALVTPESAEAYHATEDKWLFALYELDAAGIMSSKANINTLETAFENFILPTNKPTGANSMTTATITLTETELEILMQALSARDTQLRYHTQPTDMRRVALPIVQDIAAKTGDALGAIWNNRRYAINPMGETA